MKKLLVLAVAIAVSGMTVYGQGYIQVANATATAITNSVTHARATGLNVGAYFSTVAADAVNKTPAQFSTDITSLGTPLRDLVAAGIIRAGAVSFAGTAVGDTVAVQLRAWSTGYSTYEAAKASGLDTVFTGFSRPFQVTLGASQAPALISSLFTTPFTVEPVPEPSTLVLGAAGLLGLFLIRRRK